MITQTSEFEELKFNFSSSLSLSLSSHFLFNYLKVTLTISTVSVVVSDKYFVKALCVHLSDRCVYFAFSCCVFCLHETFRRNMHNSIFGLKAANTNNNKKEPFRFLFGDMIHFELSFILSSFNLFFFLRLVSSINPNIRETERKKRGHATHSDTGQKYQIDKICSVCVCVCHLKSVVKIERRFKVGIRNWGQFLSNIVHVSRL